MNVIELVEKDYERSDIPEFREGDTVRVHVKIKEGNRERTQVFEGFVLKIQNGGINKTFTVRRIASGVGVEKTFPVSSPLLSLSGCYQEAGEMEKRQKMAKLFWLMNSIKLGK